MKRFIDPIVRIVLALFGVLMLLAGTVDILAPRVRYQESRPKPVSLLAEAPTEVTVHFSGELRPDSTVHVVSTVSLLPSGELSYSGGEDVVAESGLDPNDPSHHSLRAILRPSLPHGLYRVDWSTAPSQGSARRSGCFYFGVGMPVPASVTKNLGGPIRERNVSYDLEGMSPRTIPLAGVALIAIAVFLPGLRPSRWRDRP